MSLPAAAARLERELHAEIPMARALGLAITAFDGDSITLGAPLAPNVNDKGCAFGGSLASLLTLAGWALIMLRLREADADCDVYVQDSHVDYLVPIWGDFTARAEPAEGESWDAFFASLATRGKARLRVRAVVRTPEGAPATTLEGRYVALRCAH